MIIRCLSRPRLQLSAATIKIMISTDDRFWVQVSQHQMVNFSNVWIWTFIWGTKTRDHMIHCRMEEMDQTNQNIDRSLWRYFHEWSSSDGNSSSSQGTYSNIHLQLADISLDCTPFFVVTFIWRLSYHLRPSHWKHRRKNLTHFWGHVGWHEAPYQWSIWEPFQITWWTVLRKTSVIT